MLLSASVPFALGENSTLTPGIYYSSVLGGDFRDTVTYPDNFYVGLTQSFSF